MSDNKYIVLNLENNEYDDIELEDKSGNSILWQQEAAKQLVRNLTHTGKEAKRYKSSFKSHTKAPEQEIHFSHNAICIHGDRGTGKTVFLKSAQKIWKQETSEVQSNKLPKLHFLRPIDPTMLHQHDSFASVIIAQLYNAVEDELSSQICSETKDQFYNALRDLANAHGKNSEFEDATGIDRILNYRSGIRLQEYFHNYVYKCTQILNCDGIVVSIDDVDMSLSRAFEVLDDVRKFLSCPLIIPVVSGDLALYNVITENHFKGQLQSPTKETSANFETKHSLSSSYLTKVFPSHFRISLIPIQLLQNNLLIWDSSLEKTLSFKDGRPFKSYQKHLEKIFFPLCNGQDKSTLWTQHKNARELTQIARAFPPKAIAPIETMPKGATDNQLRWFQNWSEFKQDGANYLNVLTYFKARDSLSEYGLSELPLFNILEQVKWSKELGWGYKNIYIEQKSSLEEIDEENYNNSILMEGGLNEDAFALRSMPPIESITYNLQVSVKEALKHKDKRELLLKVYSHTGYFKKGTGERPIVFFSRAFEILLCSILKVTGNSEEFSWLPLLENIFNRAPFYSVFALSPSKMIDDDPDDDNETILEEDRAALGESNKGDYPEELNNEENESTPTKILSDLSKKLMDWENKNKERFKLLNFKGLNLFPLFSSVFNKVFTQLHIYRQELGKKKNADDEYLSDAVRRFEYLVINAFVYFIKNGKLSPENIAIAARSKTVRDWESFYNTSAPLKINLEGFLSKQKQAIHETVQDLPSSSKQDKELVQVIWEHPIFNLMENKGEQPIIPLVTKSRLEEGKSKFYDETKKLSNSSLYSTRETTGNKDSGLKPLFDGIRSYIEANFGKVTNDNIEKWIASSPPNAQRYYRIIQSLLRAGATYSDLDKPRSYAARIWKKLKKRFGL